MKGGAANLLAAALVAHALSATTLFSWIDRALHRPGSYDDYRSEHALLLPIDRLSPALDEALGPTAPLVLTTRLRADEASSQRLAEGLYPRRLSPGAPFRLGLARDGALPENARALYRQDGTGLWYVVGESASPVEGAKTLREHTDVAWGDLLAGLAVVLALGAPGGVVCRRTGLALPAAILAGALAVALTYSLATWLQLAIAPWCFGILGIVALAAAARVWRRGSGNRTPTRAGRLSVPEYAVLALIVGGLLAAQLRLPQTGWDARSIWLFHAKQLALNGRMTTEDLKNPYYAFSHPEYPLLFPGWLAIHAGSGSYNERMANASIPMLFGALAWLAWGLLRLHLDRLTAAAVAMAAVLALQRNAALGYADAHLALLLLIQALALQRRETTSLGCLAAACASLLKIEGLVFSLVVTAAALALLPGPRRHRPWSALSAHLPGLASLVFARSLGLAGDFPSLAWGSVEAEPVTRAQTLLGVAGDFVVKVPLLGEAATLGVLSLVVLCVRWKTSDEGLWRRVGLSLGVAAAFVGVIFAALLLTPRDLAWHAGRSMDRLLLHPALFLLLAPFLALQSVTAPATAPGSSTPPRPD